LAVKNKVSTWSARGIAVLAAAGVGTLTQALARDLPEEPSHFSGLIDDYSPSTVTGGPYEIRGKWWLDLRAERGYATFSAALNMETSDSGKTVDLTNPTTRGAHTHHISMTDAMITYDTTGCPAFNPPTSDGFMITGMANVTGNGGPAPFGGPTLLTICVTGGTTVEFSNITLTFQKPASNHFGTQAIHGVVLKCNGPRGHDSPRCTAEK
jgi:hypothetical protein